MSGKGLCEQELILRTKREREFEVSSNGCKSGESLVRVISQGSHQRLSGESVIIRIVLASSFRPLTLFSDVGFALPCTRMNLFVGLFVAIQLFVPPSSIQSC